jgi:hypothetical protein
VGLIHLGHWAETRCFEHIPPLKKARSHTAGDDTLFGIECRLHA